MNKLEAFSGLVEYLQQGVRFPEVWQDGAWRAKYYGYYNAVYDTLATDWQQIIKQAIAEAVSQERERIIQKMRILFWFDDDAKTAGTIVTGSVIYSEFAALTQEGGTR
jgi:TRAP-type C4-dicarboxylate transport system substrate-binding protein